VSAVRRFREKIDLAEAPRPLGRRFQSHLSERVDDTEFMSEQNKRIVILCKEMDQLAREIAERERRFAVAAQEFRRLSEAAVRRTHHAALSAAAAPRRGERKGDLTSRILQFLMVHIGQSFRTADVALALGLSHRKKAIYMNLFRLSRRGQIRRTAHGFSALTEYIAEPPRFG